MNVLSPSLVTPSCVAGPFFLHTASPPALTSVSMFRSVLVGDPRWGCLGADIDVPLLQPHELLVCASTVQWRVVVQREVDKLYRSMLEMQQSKVSVHRNWAKIPLPASG